jgi:moderate conductance mechanosensitive channel
MYNDLTGRGVGPALRSICLLLWVVICLLPIPALAEASSADAPPSLSQQDMDSIVKAARDAVLQELGKQGKPAQPVSEASGLGLEDDFDELKSQSSAVYQELGRALKSFPRLASAIGKIISDAGKSTADGSGAISLIGIVLGGLGAASFAAWLTKWALERWLPVDRSSEAPMPLNRVAILALQAAVVWFVFWLISDLAASTWFSTLDTRSAVGSWLLWAPARMFLYLTIFEIFFRPTLRQARVIPLDDNDAHVAKTFFVVIAAVIVARTWVLLLSANGVRGPTLSAGLLLNNAVFIGSFFWAAFRSRTAIANWIKNDRPDTAAISGTRDFFAENWIRFAGALVLILAFGHIMGAAAGRIEVATGLTITLRIILLLIFGTALIRFVVRRLGSDRAARPDAAPMPSLSTPVGHMLRLAVFFGAIYWLAHLWLVQSLAIVDITTWQQIAVRLLGPAFVIFFGYVLWIGVKYTTNRYLVYHENAAKTGDLTSVQNASRVHTLVPLFRLAVAIVLAVIVTLLALSGMGINITPLLAGASVVGLAISFGSQALVKDVVSGIFFLADDAFRVGEYISCGNSKGVVEGFTLRSVRLRHQSGQLHTVPFGQLGEITNFSRDWTSVKFAINLDRGVDLGRVRAIAKEVGKKIQKDPEFASLLLEPLKFQGIANITDSAIVASFKFVTTPANPSAIEREAKSQLLSRFREEGIKLASQVFVPPVHSAPAT